MSKGLSLMRKFQFFDIVEGKEYIKKTGSSITASNEGDSTIKSSSTIKMSDITPHQMFASEGVVFISGMVKKKMNEMFVRENLILKIVNNVVIDEYKIFNKLYYSFQLKTLNETPYFVTIGGDFDKYMIDNEEQYLIITSIKIYDATKIIKNPKDTHDIEQYFVKKISLLTKVNSREFTLDNKIGKNIESFQNINSFAINDSFSRIAVGLDRGEIININAYPNIIECPTKNLKISFLPKIEEELHITNLSFAKVFRGFNQIEEEILYATTAKNIYYYELSSNGENVQREIGMNFEENGAYSGCIATDNEAGSLVVGSSSQTFIIEYINLERGPSWFFEGRKQCISYFKNYIMFILYEDNKFASLAVFDKANKFFVYYNNSFTRISALTADENSIYAFIDGEGPGSNNFIIKLVEKDNKEKFDTFYKKNFFDLAYDYARSLGYDKKKISEISKLHAEHAYKKGEYDKSIEQFIGTINYLDPSYVIQKFLDKSKLDFLIRYLEALEKNETFNKKDPNELKDYTALLLNCYIMQEKFPKLKDFVDNEGKKFNEDDVKTAISVCLENQNTELALFIAKKKKMSDEYLRILCVELKKYNEGIEYIKEESDLPTKYSLLCKYGEYFLQGEKTKGQIYEMVEDLVKSVIRNMDSKNILKDKFKYDDIIKIFLSQEDLLEKLLDTIMNDDPNCDNSILHKKIELRLKKWNDEVAKEKLEEKEEKKEQIEEEKKKNDEDDKKSPIIKNSILEMIKNENIQDRLDKTYLLMQFKINNFTDGITFLTEITDLKDEILLNYFESKKFDKIISFCELYAKQDNNFWIQALKFFASEEAIENGKKEDIINYLNLILFKLLDNEKYSPALGLKTVKDSNIMTIENIKSFFEKAISIEKEGYDKDKKIFDDLFSQLNKVSDDLNEIKTKYTMIKPNKCQTCGAAISLPAAHFLCQHSYHIACLNANTNDDSNVRECPKCKNDMLPLIKRLLNAEEERKTINIYKKEGDEKKASNPFKEALALEKRKFDFIASKFKSGIIKLGEPKIKTVAKGQESDTIY